MLKPSGTTISLEGDRTSIAAESRGEPGLTEEMGLEASSYRMNTVRGYRQSMTPVTWLARLKPAH
jgi:hypothetical protein